MNRTEFPSISGLILTLADDAPATARVLATLGGDERFTLGRLAGNRLPLVLEADDDRAAEERVRWLGDLPGVRRVDVVYVQLATDPDPDPDPDPMNTTTPASPTDRTTSATARA